MAEAGTGSSLNPFPPLPGHRAGRRLPAFLARGPSPLWVVAFHASLQCDLSAGSPVQEVDSIPLK